MYKILFKNTSDKADIFDRYALLAAFPVLLIESQGTV